MREIPKPGERYRHFKNKEYQILAVATHSETGEKMVVYQALYGEYGVWVRPLSMFMEEVDRVKYPEAAQKYRFERIAAGPWENPERREIETRTAEYREMEQHEAEYRETQTRLGSGRIAPERKVWRGERTETRNTHVNHVTNSANTVRTVKTFHATNEGVRHPEPDDTGSRFWDASQEEPELHPLVAEFLDQETTEGKLEVLQRMSGKVAKRDLDSLCFCLDMNPSGGSVEEELDAIRQCIRMQQRYDAPRLRYGK